MRKLSGLLLLAACELQPGPPRASPAPPPSAPAAGSAAAGREAKVPFGEQPGAGSGSGSAAAPVRAQVEITAQCLQVGAHLANIVIQSADPAQRSIFETDRDRIVRGAAEVCTTQQWSEPAIKCYLAATSHAATKECETKFPPRPAQPAPGAAAPGAPGAPSQPAVGPDGKRLEPGTPIAPPAGAGTPRAGTGSAAPRAGAGSAAPRAGAGSAAPRAGAGSAAAPRAGAGSAAAAAAPGAGAGAGAGSAAAPPAGAGSAAAPRAGTTGGGLMPPRAGSGSR